MAVDPFGEIFLNSAKNVHFILTYRLSWGRKNKFYVTLSVDTGEFSFDDPSLRFETLINGLSFAVFAISSPSPSHCLL